jgi:hypothetical protein
MEHQIKYDVNLSRKKMLPIYHQGFKMIKFNIQIIASIPPMLGWFSINSDFFFYDIDMETTSPKMVAFMQFSNIMCAFM